jgi:hypothetical protein
MEMRERSRIHQFRKPLLPSMLLRGSLKPALVENSNHAMLIAHGPAAEVTSQR